LLLAGIRGGDLFGGIDLDAIDVSDGVNLRACES
jgi:hypothetical protein